MSVLFKKPAALWLLALVSLGADAPPEPPSPDICGCRAPHQSSAILRDVTGRVFVSQKDGMRPAQTETDIPLPTRLLTGPKSETIVTIGDTCTLSVTENQLVRIEDDSGSWCARAAAVRAAIPLQPAAQSPVPISILTPLAGTSVLISIARKDQRVSR